MGRRARLTGPERTNRAQSAANASPTGPSERFAREPHPMGPDVKGNQTMAKDKDRKSSSHSRSHGGDRSSSSANRSSSRSSDSSSSRDRK